MEIQFLGAPDRTNHPHYLANVEKQGTKQRTVKNGNKTGADALAKCAVTHYLREDDVINLMASEHATVEMMHKTLSLCKKAKRPWFFGHAKKLQNHYPSLCAPWSVHVDRHLKIRCKTVEQ